MYQGKVLALIGGTGLLGRIIITKLHSLVNGGCKIIIITKKNQQNDRNKNELKPIARDKYFKMTKDKGHTEATERFIYQFVEYTETDNELEFEKPLGHVDYFFNCHPIYEPFHLTKSCERQLIWTWKLMKYFKQKHQNAFVVTLSSVYAQEPGYLSQNIEGGGQLDSIVGQKLGEYLVKTVRDNTLSEYERWRLAVNLIEQLYVRFNLANIHIVRIPVIGACADKPQGYIDKFNSISSLMYEIGLGKISELKGKRANIVDVMPVDYICNFMLALGLYSSQGTQIYNLSTSSLNPLRLGKLIQILNSYWNSNPAQNSSGTIKVDIYEGQTSYGLMKLRSRIPKFLWQSTAQIFDMKASKIQLNKEKVKTKRQREIAQKYSYFFSNQWICQTNKVIDLFNSMAPADKKILNFNINNLDWTHYIKQYCFGVQKYILGHNVEHYAARNMDMLEAKSNSYFSDIYWALSVGKNFDSKSQSQMKRYVMASQSVRKALRTLIEEKTSKLEKGPEAYSQVEEEFQKIGEAMCDRMFSQYSMNAIRMFAWFMHKVFKIIYEQVVIDKDAILRLKALEDRNEGPIILMPTHRSYIDFIILSYIFFGYGLKCPHIAAAEDFLNMAIVHILLRKSGAFFIRRDQQENRVLYKAIMTEYVTKVLMDRSHLEFFIEGTRSRVGKMLEPKYGILTMVVDAVTTNKIPDAFIVPLTINYEKVLEGATFPLELLGQSKVKESLGRLIKAVDTLKENYGRIYIEFCPPISVRRYMDEGSKRKKTQKELIFNLGYEITYSLSDNLVVMPPAIVASIVLMQRRGISEQQLDNYVEWFCKQVHSRGIKIARTQQTSSISATNALTFLDDIVLKTKKNIFELDLSMNEETINIFLLSYYKNTLTHIFFLQAIILTSLYSFGYEAAAKEGILMENLKDEIQFLYSLLKKEYVLRDNLANVETMERYLELLIIKNVIIRDGIKVRSNEKKSFYYTFLCSLIWPLVESYWLTSLYFFNLDKLKTSIPIMKLVGQIQWFGEEMFQQRVIEHYEAVSQDTIKNAVNAFSRLGLVRIIKEQVQENIVQSVQLNVPVGKLKQVEQHLSRFLKSKYAKSVKGLVDPTRSSVIMDFPFLAKL